jgi:hypothetical protein
MAAVVSSSMIGLPVDLIMFLWLSFGECGVLPSQIIGKARAVLISISLVRLALRAAPAPA